MRVMYLILAKINDSTLMSLHYATRENKQKRKYTDVTVTYHLSYLLE